MLFIGTDKLWLMFGWDFENIFVIFGVVEYHFTAGHVGCRGKMFFSKSCKSDSPIYFFSLCTVF